MYHWHVINMSDRYLSTYHQFPGIALGRNTNNLRTPAREPYAHRPSSAMIPAPRNMQASAYKSFPRLASRISGLNKNSWARSSTNPVYSKIPALNESRTPETKVASVEPGLYDARTPRPTAIPIGVVMP